jgi:HlyD family secretion protein
MLKVRQAVAEAKRQWDGTTIYAPADGTISMLNVELGERVLLHATNDYLEILRVINLNNMEWKWMSMKMILLKIKVGDDAS